MFGLSEKTFQEGVVGDLDCTSFLLKTYSLPLERETQQQKQLWIQVSLQIIPASFQPKNTSLPGDSR